MRKVLLTDITYIPYKDGFCYLSAVIDAQSNEVLAHVVSTSLKEQFVLDTLDQLKGIDLAESALVHSDQGIHYQALAYREKLGELRLVQSMSRKACCWDNASIESWFGRMKQSVGFSKKMTFEEVCDKVEAYIEYYNYFRGQKRLGWLTPIEYGMKLAA